MKITKCHQFLVLLSSFVAQFVSEGIMWSFTIYYPILTRHFHASNAEISLIGSFSYGCWCCIGPFSGYLVGKVGSTPVLMLSSVFGAIFLISAAFATRLWQIIICFSIFSLFCGMAYIPSITVVSDFFGNFRNFATTIATVGGAAGAVCYPLLFQYLLIAETWQYCFVMTSGLMLQLVVCSLILQRKPSTKLTEKYRKNVEVLDELPSQISTDKFNRSFCNKTKLNFAFYSIHCFLWNLTGFGFYTILPLYLDHQGYSVTDTAFVLSICAFAVILGRCAAAICCIRKNFDRILFFNFSTLVTVVWVSLFVLDLNFLLYCTFSACYGLFLGIQTALMPVVTLEILDHHDINVAFGIIVFACGASGLLSPYACGLLIDLLQRYDYVFGLISFPSFVCCFFMMHMHWPFKACAERPTNPEANST